MNIRFWGVRGSIPTPVTPRQIQSKIIEAVQRITPEDIKDEDSRMKFVESLPSWLYGTVGGNTPCIEIKLESGDELVFDAGSGIRVMGKEGIPPSNLHYSVFFSHFHWDHIQGLPFFDQAYNPNSVFDIYSPFKDMKEYLSGQMVSPYYPVTFQAFSKNMNFHCVQPGDELSIGSAKVTCVKMSHPGGSYSYAVVENGRKFVYATDVELGSKDFVRSDEKVGVFENADVLVMDAQYTAEEAMRKENWGHSAFCYAVDFAILWNIKSLYLFHHEPTYDDRKLDVILESARWYSEYIKNKPVSVYLAYEGLEIKL